VHEFVEMLDAVQPTVVGILEDNFNFLTKMCTVRMREAAFEMVRAAKARGCRVAINGADATDQTEQYLAAGADAVIVGEVELTFAELADVWSRDPDAPLEGIAGLAIQENGSGTRRTTPRGNIEELDSLPFPAWDLVDHEKYRAAWTGVHGRMSWNMIASRGCPYRCNWCAKPLFGSRYTQRNPASVAEEMRQLREQVAPDHLWFTDDIFGLTAPWIEEFAREVKARDARIPFLMQSRVNLMKPAVVAALAEAGAEEVWMGVESGSQKILDAMEKRTTIDQIRDATRVLRAHGVRSAWFIQLGYLGEDWADIVMTRDLIRDERPDDIGVSISYPLPGTRFYDMVKDQLGSKKNWSHSDDLTMMFHGTYQTSFYKQIRDLLHDEVRALAAGGAGAAHEFDARWAELKGSEVSFRSSPELLVPVA
jgi:anaerobic magnesium-protoporphyrin IX monomethyl ester cyclase